MAFYKVGEVDLGALQELTERVTPPEEVPFAAEISKGVPIYDVAALAEVLTGDRRDQVLSEWARVFETGAGVVVLKGAMPDVAAIDAASDVFNRIIGEEAMSAGGGADHFAAAGENARIWNSAQKLCLEAPEIFATYFSAPAIEAVCEAWVGPGFQMTAQVNVVRPGGAAQEAHRDYHLGFQTAEQAARYPVHMHALSPALTLQGAVAHCDMPIQSGPTKLLPHSQNFGPGYVVMREPGVRALFEDRCIQLPLNKGDALFFNPAVFHAAGPNVSSDIQRMANLMQISSPFGRALEALDRDAMVIALYPELQRLALAKDCQSAAIAAAAEGYPFPTNLDTDPPVGGLAPESQQALMMRCLDEGMDAEGFAALVRARSAKKHA